MKTDKFEAVIEILKKGSLSEAAKSLGITQSAITQALKNLEDEFGFKILIRNKGGISLTKNGEQICDALFNAVDAKKRLYKIIDEINANQINTIKVAAFKSVAVNWLPSIIKEFQKKYPDTEFKLYDGNYEDIEEYIKNKSVDIAFISVPISTKCDYIPIFDDEILAVLPKNHSMANLERFPVSQFAKEPVVSLIDSTNQDAQRIFDSNHIVPDIKFKTADDYAMIAMVESELGICISQKLILRNDNHNVVALSLTPPAKRKIAIAIPDPATLKPIVNDFIEFTGSWIGNLDF